VGGKGTDACIVHHLGVGKTATLTFLQFLSHCFQLCMLHVALLSLSYSF
jgi:hypothetical protein